MIQIEELRKELKRYPAKVAEIYLKRFLEKQKAQSGEGNPATLRRVKAIENFRVFLNTYFSHYFSTEFGEQQLELIEDIQAFAGKKGRGPMKIIRALSRGFGKSTILSLCGVMWLVLRRDWHFVIMVSASLTQAKGFLQKIVDECEDNELLISDFPELRPAKDQKGQNVAWNDLDIVFRGGARIIAKGFLNAIRGTRYRQYRPDALIVDDPDEEKDVESDSRMQKKYRWFDRAALKLGAQWGIDVVLSYTTLSPNCVGEVIYNDTKKYWDWNRKKFSAIGTRPDGSEYSTWEAGAPLSMLVKEREVDPISFARERQNVILAEIDQKFKGRIQAYEFVRPESFEGWTLGLAVDLSLGKTQRSDYSAIVGVGLSPQGKFYELYSDIARRPPDQIQIDLVKALRAFPWTVAGVETSGGQEYFLDAFKRHLEDWNELCVNPNIGQGLTPGDRIIVPMVGIPNTGDKIKRIEGALQTIVATGLMLLRSDSHLLFEMLNEFPYKKLDGPDALEMAHRLIVEQMGNMISIVTPEQLAKARERESGLRQESQVTIGKSIEQLRREQLRRRGY
ncbi:hypothetical protein EHQ43_10110 [Leptospira bouyouniensis]|uniref:Terminase large subunit gp17-like C-terminal domain-containing protein n=1 Tax=Leptospira bouyouniensis TaxID=2484911 RepID=A0A7I0HRM7_9LEPT|nr:hypothetical protein [Leptospira bouyouniensis]TGL04989.1 hypothetical protein EHQ43_10110 [Leptospira bouyouniensis]